MMYEEIRYFSSREVHVRAMTKNGWAARTLCGKRTSSAISRRRMTTALQLGGNENSKTKHYGCATCRSMYGNSLERRY